MVAINARVYPKGHKLTWRNTRLTLRKGGGYIRVCLDCQRDRTKKEPPVA